MKIDKILTPQTTGWLTTASLGASIISGISKNKVLKKTHKPFAYMSLASMALHIGILEYTKHKYKKM